MLYAKSYPIESIKQHTEKLLEEYEILKRLYGDEIIKNKEIDEQRFWKILKIACLYHDVGKAYTPFQNEILKKLGIREIETKFSYSNIKHEQLSPLFIPIEKLELNEEEERLLVQIVFYHHERENVEVDRNLVQEIIEEDILPRYEEIKNELEIELNDYPNTFYLKYVTNRSRIKANDKLYIEYGLLKGLLHKIDHSASSGIKIEDETPEKVSQYTENFIKNQFNLNDLQIFCKKNQDNNLLVIGSTGIGKTEAALIWSKNSKTFFTLPIRVSINAIFDRIHNLIGYSSVGLLHSTALDYLENKKEEMENSYEIYKQSQILSCKITTCTIDQIFTFVFKFKGYEKIYAMLSYSKVIIDEIQAYSPEIVAVILKGIKMINDIGGKFMIMTATLPRIYKEKLEEYNIKFEYNQFKKEVDRHRIKVKEVGILEDINFIKEKGKNSKVLVIANTVNKAIEIYRELKKIGATDIKLLHSRFIERDKETLEEEIKKFSDSNEIGIWISTQIVEASLDIDFDYLFTEMSTLDSLFQRLGRCYRKREYVELFPNVYIYNKDLSGIGFVYDKDINENSIKLLSKYDEKILKEEDKINLVDVLYSREMLKNTNFLKEFEAGLDILENIVDYQTNKKETQKMLRKIENIKVIPKRIYDQNIDLITKYKQCKDYKQKNILRRNVDKLIINIRASVKWKYHDKITEITDDIYCIDLKYESNIGLIIEEDKEYDQASRMF